jgi:hypothetical protein
MMKYDPLKAPDAVRWLAMDEGERIALVREYHRRAKIRLPNQMVHAAIHAVVETQIAGHEVPAREALQRLMKERLDRHEAVHAIGTVLAGHMYKIMTHAESSGDPNAEYCRELMAITAAKWREENQGETEGGDGSRGQD